MQGTNNHKLTIVILLIRNQLTSKVSKAYHPGTAKVDTCSPPAAQESTEVLLNQACSKLQTVSQWYVCRRLIGQCILLSMLIQGIELLPMASHIGNHFSIHSPPYVLFACPSSPVYHGESIHLTLWIKVSQPEYCSTMMELVNLFRTESSTPDFGVQWVNMNIFNIRFVWSHTQNRVHRIIWLVELIYQFHKFDKGLSGGHQSSRWSSFWYCYIYKNNEPNL